MAFKSWIALTKQVLYADRFGNNLTSNPMYQAYRAYTGRNMEEEKTSTSSETPTSCETLVTSSEGHQVDANALANGEKPSSSKPRKDFKSALIILPPESVWEKIQDIRRIHDDRFDRWMPHINLVYPFYKDEEEVFTNAASQLKDSVSGMQPFKVSFTKKSFNYFIQKKYCTLWLRPLVVSSLSCDGASNIIQSTTDIGINNDNIGINADCGINTDINQDFAGDSGDTRDLNQVNTSDTQESSIVGTGHGKDESDELRDNFGGAKPKKLKKSERKAANKKKRSEGSLLSEYAINNPPHPEVLEIHSLLQQVYPDLISDEHTEFGFQPHLSLGQFKLHEVEKYKQKFANDWTDIEFEVSSVCLISRKDFNDPFHVKETVLFGVDKNESH